MKFIAIIFVSLMPVVAHAETVEGMARVVDGDTIEVKDQKIRLWGIDAPELAQRCTEDGAVYPCGLDASHALAKRIERKQVTCVRRDTDRYGRMVALCTVEGVDISQWMVAQGQAIAFRKYSLDYVADEDRARAAKAGLWAGEFQDPSDFRHQKRGGQGSARPEHATPRGKPGHAAPALARMIPTVPGTAAVGEALIYDWAAAPQRVWRGNSLGGSETCFCCSTRHDAEHSGTRGQGSGSL